MPLAQAILQPIVSALDSLGIGVCVFDGDDAALLWNRSFLRFFPEHEGHLQLGEPYADNLRRFYRGRLDASELPRIEDYIKAGIARHREQRRPYVFEHRGVSLNVASLPLPGIGRIRIWTPVTPPPPGYVPPDGIVPRPGDAGAALSAQLREFEHVADGIMLVDGQGSITWVNDQFVVLYGLPEKAPVIGLRFADVFAMAWAGREGEAAALHDLGVATLADNLRFTGAPFQLPLPGARWVRVIGQRGPRGAGYFSHVDITLFKQQERELLEKTALLETTLSSISQGIFMIDPDGRLITWNRRVQEILDLPATLLASRPTLNDMTRFQLARGDFGDEALKVEGHARTYVSAGGDGPSPDRYLRTTTQGRVLEVRTQTLASGGMVRTFSDVTDYVRAQEEIRRLNHELQDRVRERTSQLEGATRELDAFSYSIAHDLRQPLSSIDGFSSLLAAQAPGEAGTATRHYVERIRAGVKQMSALTDGLLSLAGLSRRKLHWNQFDLGAMARDVLDGLAAREPHRRVRVDIQPGMRATGEPALIRQVLENLLDNAWKFTVREADARISVGRLAGEDVQEVYFVSDNGVGFDMAYAAKLFGTFQRLHSPNDFVGLGIGLAIAHRIVARHGGRIWASAAPGKGADFYFTLGQETKEE